MLNSLLTATLLVRRWPTGKIDTEELLVLAAERPRFVHSCVNEVIEIDGLDLEGVHHMGAAGMEEFRHPMLIPIATKLCLYSRRGCRHLAKRQRRSKNFDKKRFHLSPRFNLPSPCQD